MSYIANELLENAVKFNKETEGYPIRIALYLLSDTLWFYVTNCVDEGKVGEFKELIGKLLTDDTKKLYLGQLESNAAEGNEGVSRLGLL